MSTLGQRIRMLRSTQKMNQTALAKEMHVSMYTVSAWERDLQKPEYSKLQSLSKLFNVNLSYLLGESEDSSPPIPNVDEEAIWADDDVEAMRNASRMLTQLSFSSRMIIRASIIQAFQIEKDAGTLRKGYDVTMTRYDDDDDDESVEDETVVEESLGEEPVDSGQSEQEDGET